MPRENAVVRCKTLRILRERNAFELISDARDAFRKTVVDTRQREREKERERKTRKERRTPNHSSLASIFVSRRGREKSEGIIYGYKILEDIFLWLQFCLSFVSVLKKVSTRSTQVCKRPSVRGGNVKHLFRYAALSKQPLTN